MSCTMVIPTIPKTPAREWGHRKICCSETMFFHNQPPNSEDFLKNVLIPKGYQQSDSNLNVDWTKMTTLNINALGVIPNHPESSHVGIYRIPDNKFTIRDDGMMISVWIPHDSNFYMATVSTKRSAHPHGADIFAAWDASEVCARSAVTGSASKSVQSLSKPLLGLAMETLGRFKQS